MIKQFKSISSYIDYSQAGGRHKTFMVKNDMDRTNFLDLFPEDVIDEIGYILYRVQVNTTHAIAFIDKREVHR